MSLYTEIIDGHPVEMKTKYNEEIKHCITTVVNDQTMLDFTEDERDAILDWMRKNLIPRKTFNHFHTSYGLKHIVENGCDAINYMTNNQLKDAMLMLGFQPLDPSELNWVFKVSERSPAFVCRRY